MNQGIAVYGNKGSTDQHAYVQQLRDGVPNFFVTFIEVRKDRAGERSKWSPESRAAIISKAFCAEHATALYESGRDSITISIPEVNAFYGGRSHCALRTRRRFLRRRW